MCRGETPCQVRAQACQARPTTRKEPTRDQGGQDAKSPPKPSTATAKTELHFILDVVRLREATKASLVFLPGDSSGEELAFKMHQDQTRSSSYAVVVQAERCAAYKYLYRVWCGTKCKQEKEEREVIPTKRRELVLDKYDEQGKCKLCHKH